MGSLNSRKDCRDGIERKELSQQELGLGKKEGLGAPEEGSGLHPRGVMLLDKQNDMTVLPFPALSTGEVEWGGGGMCCHMDHALGMEEVVGEGVERV